MTATGKVQLVAWVDKETRTAVKIEAIRRGKTVTDLILDALVSLGVDVHRSDAAARRLPPKKSEENGKRRAGG